MKESREPASLTDSEKQVLFEQQRRSRPERSIKPTRSNKSGFVLQVATAASTFDWIPKVSVTSSLFNNPPAPA